MRQPTHRLRQFGDRRPFGCSKHLDRRRQLRPDPRRARCRERRGAFGSGRSSGGSIRLGERWRLIALWRRSFFVSGRARVVIRIDGDHLCSGGRQRKGIGLPVLLIAPPGRHSRLGLDLLDQASRNQLRRDFMRRDAFQLFGQRQAAIVPLRGSAQHDELRVGKFDGHGNRPFIVMRPSQSRPLTDASPGSGDRPGLRVVRASSIRRAYTFTLSFKGKASLFCAFRAAISVELCTFDSHGFQFGVDRFRALASSTDPARPKANCSTRFARAHGMGDRFASIVLKKPLCRFPARTDPGFSLRTDPA